ncbi:hypothetical protein J6590_097032, partial [Homalodisca vitripennis]
MQAAIRYLLTTCNAASYLLQAEEGLRKSWVGALRWSWAFVIRPFPAQTTVNEVAHKTSLSQMNLAGISSDFGELHF